MAFELTPSNLLLVFSVVLVFGFVGRWLFERSKIPDTLLLILLGVIIASVFDIDQEPFMAVMPYVGVLALITILFDGGMTLRFQDLVSGLPRASALSFSGFFLSVLVTMVYGKLALDLSWMKAAMLGSIVGGTSAVVILPMIAGLDLGKKAETLIGLESALTDVLSVVGTLAIAGAIATGQADGLGIVRGVAAQFAVALLVGVLVGIFWIMLSARLQRTGSEYLWTITGLFALYGAVELFGGSGPIAVLAFAVIIGNATQVAKTFGFGKGKRQRIAQRLGGRHGELSFFVRSFFFVFLGMLIDPNFFTFGGGSVGAAELGNATATNNSSVVAAMQTSQEVGGRVIAALVGPGGFFSSPLVLSFGLFVMLVLARIGAVWLATLGDPKLINHRHRFVLLMPRGLAAAVLATIPAAAPYRITGIESFVGYAFAILLFSNLAATGAAFVGKPMPLPGIFGRWTARERHPNKQRRRRSTEDEIDDTLGRRDRGS